MKPLQWLKNKCSGIYEVPHGKHDTINSIEGLRAIAAFMVFVVHYAAQFAPWIDTGSLTSELIGYYRHIGAKGVELFFVISGFLIYGMLIRKSVSFPSYFKRRVKRLYPTFLVMISLYIVLSLLFPSESKIPPNIVDAFTYILANILMLPGLFDINPIMTVAWSLSYEMFLYLSLPLFIMLFKLRDWSVVNRILLLITITLIGFYFVMIEYNSHDKMILFISGMLAFEITQNIRVSFSGSFIRNSFLITIAILLLLRYLSIENIFVLLTLFIGFFFTFVSCLNEGTMLNKLCTTTFLRYFGNMSYSYYLMHGITLKCFFLILATIIPPSHQWDIVLYFAFFPVFALTWFTSTILFVLVEKPASLTPNKSTKPAHAR